MDSRFCLTEQEDTVGGRVEGEGARGARGEGGGNAEAQLAV